MIIIAISLAFVAGAALGGAFAALRSHERIALLREQLAGAEAAPRAPEVAWAHQGEAIETRLIEMAIHLNRLDDERRRESTVLSEAVRTLHDANVATRDEARNLARALSDNRARGVWGEMQLRRVLEVSGLAMHADFVEQRGVSSSENDGRPDVVVHLPNDRRVVVDAKAPLDRFLKASNCDDPAQRAALVAEHGKAVHAHVVALSRRSYADHVDGSVDFVVMFVPGDPFLTAALEGRPGLLEEAFALNVVLASPSSLLALLRAVACGWRERHVTEEAESIAKVGRELSERICVFADHVNRVGGALGTAVAAYNSAVGSLDKRLAPSARRLAEHGAGTTKMLVDPRPIDELPGQSALGSSISGPSRGAA